MGLEIGPAVSRQAPPEQQWAATWPVGGEATSSRQREGDRDRNAGELGRAGDSGTSGDQEILLGKTPPVIRQAHPQGPGEHWVGGQLTSPEKEHE